MPLRRYQETALHDVGEHFANGLRSVCLVSPTGSGKTHMGATWLTGDSGIANAPVRHREPGLWVVHRIELLRQAFESLQRILPGKVAIIRAGSSTARYLAREPRVYVATIQSLLASGERPDVKRIVLDEAHHYAADDWGSLVHAYPDAKLLGLTATPERKDGRALGDIFQALVVAARYPELVADGHLVPCRAFAPPEAVDRGVANDPVAMYQRYGDNAAGFLFAGSIASADLWAERFTEADIPTVAVHQRVPARKRKQALDDFAAGRIRLLSNVYVLTEGVDVPAARVCILCRAVPHVGNYLQCLDAQTEILTKRGFIGPDDITDADEIGCAIFNERVPKFRWSPILSRVDRPLAAEERMFELKGQGRDIRVTGGHRLYTAPSHFKGNRGKTGPWNRWNVRTAEERAFAKGHYKMPVAAVEGTPGLPLTDDELRFIGWFLTDGSRNKCTNAISIAQAEGSPHRPAIEACLRGCGFRFGLHIVQTNAGRFPNAQPLCQYTVSYGDPRKHSDRHLTGWKRLEPYIDKSLAPSLEGLSRAQLAVLLEAIHLGDGIKHVTAGQTWTRRSYHICTGNLTFAERLQSLCIRRGFRCNLAKDSGRDFWVLHIKDTTEIAVGSERAPDRPVLVPSPATPGERVWCVETLTGSIVTRRNGHVAILGNCAGRVLRPSPGKQDAILIDLCGSVLEHGLPTEDRAYSLDGRAIRRTTASVRQCPQCGAVHDGTPTTCDLCGYIFPKPDEQPTPPPRIYDMELREVYAGAKTPVPSVQREFDRLVSVALERDFSLGWVVKQFVALFGSAPTAWLAALPEEVRRREYDKLAALGRERGYKSGFAAARYRELMGQWPPWAWRQAPTAAPSQPTASSAEPEEADVPF